MAINWIKTETGFESETGGYIIERKSGRFTLLHRDTVSPDKAHKVMVGSLTACRQKAEELAKPEPVAVEIPVEVPQTVTINAAPTEEVMARIMAPAYCYPPILDDFIWRIVFSSAGDFR